ncbi:MULTISPECIES: hypothetical protein [Sporosarcina]|uniref:hypothetical protein n=1 Tax=Sporosarcina TaxID=1569 RepID=UPI00058EE577|nr:MULTISPECIES: hypothetical protein [Sporosarcina]WJY28712.1 hypothetical protein QWT68_06930 [Sporosarcina sp. 0.2-SM1T-5]
MTAIFLVLLFILQLGSFYFIALLYMRLSRLDNTEKQQKQLMKEMEDSLALYMSDVKEENDRLIEELGQLKDRSSAAGKPAAQTHEAQTAPGPDRQPADFEPPKPPVLKVMNSYQAQQGPAASAVARKQGGGHGQDGRTDAAFEEVYRLHSEGISPEEIASRLGKGKTEVELILKFKQ